MFLLFRRTLEHAGARLLATSRRSVSRPKRRVRLVVEQLEDRMVPTIVDGTGLADLFIVSSDGDGSTIVTLNGSVVESQQTATLTTLTINGLDGDDTIVIDQTSGNPLPTGNIIVNGGPQGSLAPGDTLELIGGTFTTILYDFVPGTPGNGSVQLDGCTITYTGLEPVLNTGNSVDTIFNLPSSNGDDVAQLEDDGIAGNNVSRLRSLVGSFEQTDFMTPTGSLTINLGNDGESYRQQAPDSLFDVPNLEVNGGAAADSFRVFATPASVQTTLFGTPVGTGNDGFADTVTVGSASNSLDTILGGVAYNEVSGAAPLGFTDKLIVLDQGDADTNDYLLDADLDGGGIITRVSGATITYNLNVDRIELHTGDGNNTIDVNEFGDRINQLLVDAGGGNDSINVASLQARLGADGTPVSTIVAVLGGGSEDDFFDIAPSNGGRAFLNVLGGSPQAPASPGDTLRMDLTDVPNAVATIGRNGAGLWTFGGGFDPLAFNDVEILDALNGIYDLVLNLGTAADVDLRRNPTSPAFDEIRVAGLRITTFDESDVTTFTLNGSNGNDSLGVDQVNGNPIPFGGVFFNGNGQSGPAPGDTLNLLGGTFDSITYNYTPGSPGRGSVELASDSGVGISTSIITYTGLEPVLNTGNSVDTIFNLPSSNGDDMVELTDDDVAGNNVSRLRSLVGSFEQTDFMTPTGSLTINLGNDGESYRQQAPDSLFDVPNLEVNGGAAADSFRVFATPAGVQTTLFGTPVGTGNDGFADTVTVGSASNSLDTILGGVAYNEEFGTGLGGAADQLTLLDQGDADPNDYLFGTMGGFSTITRIGAAPITYSGVGTIRLEAGAGNDNINVDAVADRILELTVNAGGGNDLITVNGPNLGGSATSPSLNVFNGEGGNDTFDVTPIPNGPISKSITVNGGPPSAPVSPGDTLNVDLTGVIEPAPPDLTGNGSFTSASHQTIVFTDLEPLPGPATLNSLFAVGAVPLGNTHVTVYEADRSVRFSFLAYPGFQGPVRVAMGDVSGDGIPDVIVGSATSSSHVKVFDGRNLAELFSFFAYAGYNGGVNVAAGDVDGDGRADVITGSDTSSAHVKVFSGLNGAELFSFFAYADYNGGVTVASGDVDGDNRADVITGSATSSSHVKVFSGLTGAELASFFAYAGYNGGVDVGAGDLDRDGRVDLIVASLGSSSHVKAFSGATQAELASFFAYGGYDGGVTVGSTDSDGDGGADVITGSRRDSSHVKAFRGMDVNELTSFFAFDATFPGVSVS